jgi:hypothetical protein
MSTYSIDPLHPDRVRCEDCNEVVAAVPQGPAADLPGTEGLTRRQLLLAGPDVATLETLAEHDALCAWRRSPRGTVYVQLLPRNDEDGQ